MKLRRDRGLCLPKYPGVQVASAPTPAAAEHLNHFTDWLSRGIFSEEKKTGNTN
jgi:hypothetical protein